MSDWKERRAKLRGRTETSAENSEGKSTSLITGKELDGREMKFAKKPKFGREVNMYDIIPFEITAEWYKDLRTFSGQPTGLEVGDVDYKLEVPVHRTIPGNEKARCVCLKEAFGKPCPVCQERDRLMSDAGKDEDPDGTIAKSLQPKWRTFYNLIDLNNDDEIVIWEYSYHLFEKALLLEVNVGAEGLQFFWDIEEDGKTIQWRGKQKSFGGNKFVEADRIDFIDREPYNESILKETFPLDKIINIMDYETIQAMMLGVSADEIAGDDKAEAPAETESKPAAGRSRFGRDRRAPRETAADTCSQGLKIGTDFGSQPECQGCPDDEYDKCEAAANNAGSDNADDVFEEDIPDPVEEPAEAPRRTRRARR